MDPKVIEVSSLSLSFSLFLSLSLSFSLFPSLSLTINLPTYRSIYPSIHPSIHPSLSLCVPTYLPIYLSFFLSVCLFIYLPVYLQAWKPRYSARLLHVSKLTTSKTKQFCETSSFFEVDNIKNERILRDFLQKWKVECRADGLVPMRFAIFPLHLSKVLRMPRKIDARSYEVLHLSRKIILANLQIWCSKMQPFSGNQRPGLLTSLMNMSFVLRLPREMHLCRSSSNVPHLPSFLKMLHSPHVLLTFEKVHNPLRLPRKTTSERPKVVRTPGVLNILTSKCASRHNGVHFFDIATSKSGPKLVCLYMLTSKCASRQNGVHFFRHLNFQKWSENCV